MSLSCPLQFFSMALHLTQLARIWLCWTGKLCWMRSGCVAHVLMLRAYAGWRGGAWLDKPVVGPMPLSLGGAGQRLCLFLSGFGESSNSDNRGSWCCGATALCQALNEDFTCIISFHPPSLVCCLKATSNHVRKVVPKAVPFYGTLEEEKMFPLFRIKLLRAINISVWYK